MVSVYTFILWTAFEIISCIYVFLLIMDPYGIPYGGVAYNSHEALLVNIPTQHLHIRLLRFFLRVVSGWPGSEIGEKALFFEGKPHAIYNTSLTIIFFTMQVLYLLENYSRLTFFETGHMYLALMLNILSMSRGFTLCLSQRYRNLAAKFLTQLHVFYYKDKSDYSRKIYLQVHKICHFCTLLLIFNTTSTVLFFNIVPMAVNIKAGKFNGFNDPVNTTLELPMYVKLPNMDPERSFNDYIFSFIFNWYITFLGASSIIMFDLLLCIMIFHLWGHFKILLHDLDNFPKPIAITSKEVSDLMKEGAMYTPTEQEDIAIKLKDSIRYHRMITEFVFEMSECFGMALFIFYAFHQASGCLLLLEISQGNSEALALYIPLAVLLITELIQISIIFEIIGTMSEQLRDEVYCIPWEYMNTKNRSTMLLFLMSVDKPIHVKAGGVVDVGVTTMARILKTSFSYYAILRTMNSDD